MSLCCTGTLTNIALLVSSFPEVEQWIEQVVIMGGGLHEHNINGCAEYNIYCDPEAASILFHSNLEVKLLWSDGAYPY